MKHVKIIISLLWAFIFLLVMLTSVSEAALLYQATVTPVEATVINGANARTGPGLRYDVIQTVSAGERFPVMAYAVVESNLYWYEVQLDSGGSAWLMADVLSMPTGVNLAYLPQMEVLPPTPFPTATPTVPPADGLEAQLQAVALLPALSPHVMEIYQWGQQLGNNPHVFAKAGDSNSDSPRFLTEIDQGHYDLGNYGHLQSVIDFYAQSFGRSNQSTNGGFNISTIQDTLLADPRYCEPGETPLTCEFRISKPSLVFIMPGLNDLQDIKIERFGDLLRQMMDTCIEFGVVPVVNTYTVQRDNRLWQKTLEMNVVVTEVAAEYDIPIINFWLGAQSLPNNGISQDAVHFTYGGQYVSFNGEEAQYGHDLRNLLTLIFLDHFHREIVMGDVGH